MHYTRRGYTNIEILKKLYKARWFNWVVINENSCIAKPKQKDSPYYLICTGFF